MAHQLSKNNPIIQEYCKSNFSDDFNPESFLVGLSSLLGLREESKIFRNKFQLQGNDGNDVSWSVDDIKDIINRKEVVDSLLKKYEIPKYSDVCIGKTILKTIKYSGYNECSFRILVFTDNTFYAYVVRPRGGYYGENLLEWTHFSYDSYFFFKMNEEAHGEFKKYDFDSQRIPTLKI